jgi:hypothetical protein
MTIVVNTYSEQEEKALLDFLESRHYNYKSTDENTVVDVKFLEDYNKDLEESEAQIDAGEYYTHDEVKKNLAVRRKRISGD